MKANVATVELLKAAVANPNFNPTIPEHWEDLFAQVPKIKNLVKENFKSEGGGARIA